MVATHQVFPLGLDTLHDIIETQSDQFERLLGSLGHNKAHYLKRIVALEDKLRAALPEELQKDFVHYSDATYVDVFAQLEAGYLIGLAVGASFREGAR